MKFIRKITRLSRGIRVAIPDALWLRVGQVGDLYVLMEVGLNGKIEISALDEGSVTDASDSGDRA